MNNTTSNQEFVSCEGDSIYGKITDTFSPKDVFRGFERYPSANHHGEIITVDDFVRIY